MLHLVSKYLQILQSSGSHLGTRYLRMITTLIHISVTIRYISVNFPVFC